MLKHYFKTAWRTLARNKSYAFLNIAGLSLGLAASWLILLYISGELSFDRFNKKADRIFRVVQHTKWNNNDLHQATTSAPFAPALQTSFPGIENTVRIDLEGGGIITTGKKKIKQEDIIFADPSFFNIFSYHFIYGSSSNALINPGAVVIDETLAQKLFGNPEKAFNQTVYFDENQPALITGVIKDIPNNSHLQFSGVRAASANHFSTNWQNFSIYTYILLKEGVNVKSLEKQLPAFAKNTIQAQMKVDDYKIELQPLTSIHLYSNLSFEPGNNGSISRIYIFSAIALLILFIAIINYTNLTTARSSSRVREIGVRKVIGSGKNNIAGIFIAESMIITFIAMCIALLVVKFSLPWFNHLTEKNLSLLQFGIPKTVTAFAVFLMLTGVISGIYPSIFIASFKTIPSLKGQIGNITGNIIFRKSLVVFQFVVTILMIASTIIIYQQLHFARNTNLGFNKDQVLTFHIDDYNVRKQVAALKTELMKDPSVEGVAVAGNPIGNNDLGGMGYRFEIPGGGFTKATTLAQELMIDEDFLKTMDIKLLQGRNFSPAITSDKYGAALINESLMKKLGWPDAIGKRIQFYAGENQVLERVIVGVVNDFHTYSLQYKIEPLVMVMPPSEGSQDNIYVKLSKGKIAEGLAYIKETFNHFDKTNQATYNFLDHNFAKQYNTEEKQGQIAMVFAVLAIIIACLGLFGLAALTAIQRTKEIGIRKILGATIYNIVSLLSSDFLILISISAAIALPVAWITMNEWLNGFAYRISIQWWILVLAGLLAFIIALLTVSIQAVKVAIADPVKSLRTE